MSDQKMYLVQEAEDFVIKIPDTVELPKKSVDIHGITRLLMKRKGVSISYALDRFDNAIRLADVIVAHNLTFDKNMLIVEAYRLSRPNFFTTSGSGSGSGVKEHCTMKANIKRCNIVRERANSTRYLKYPRLSELHDTLFNYIPKGTHNAMADVLICLRCYLFIEFNKDIATTPNLYVTKLFKLYCC